MTEAPPDILQRIGNTTLMPLRRIVPKGNARILLKLESENPTGSMKDRMALAMIEAAEEDGRRSQAVRWWNTPAAAPASRWRWCAR